MRKYLKPIFSILAVVAILLCFFVALDSVRGAQAQEGRQQLEAALRRSAAACYASEGIYPPNLTYLQEHYGIRIDETRYAVFYEVFADNLMPQITVLERGS